MYCIMRYTLTGRFLWWTGLKWSTDPELARVYSDQYTAETVALAMGQGAVVV
jgi:hypothetical protein